MSNYAFSMSFIMQMGCGFLHFLTNSIGVCWQKYQAYENTVLATNHARNEYLIQLCAANQNIHRYFTDEVSDILDVSHLVQFQRSCAPFAFTWETCGLWFLFTKFPLRRGQSVLEIHRLFTNRKRMVLNGLLLDLSDWECPHSNRCVRRRGGCATAFSFKTSRWEPDSSILCKKTDL